jgi:hypothetical protein
VVFTYKLSYENYSITGISVSLLELMTKIPPVYWLSKVGLPWNVNPITSPTAQQVSGHSYSALLGLVFGTPLSVREFRVRVSILNHRVQTGSGAHPASYPMGTGDSLPGGKEAGA